mmetsp:Transcript_20188/g.43507  ORF Transcript_20188/g.43507 Transcript_20188/m.43507 type:complete len:88 (-) Transcript_20188:181-444(-)
MDCVDMLHVTPEGNAESSQDKLIAPVNPPSTLTEHCLVALLVGKSRVKTTGSESQDKKKLGPSDGTTVIQVEALPKQLALEPFGITT